MTARTQGAGEGAITLDVSLLGRDYKVACKAGEEAELRNAVAFLDRRMREIRDGGKTLSVERIAVMAALNLAHEYQRERLARPADAAAPTLPAIIDAPAARRRIASMKSAIEQTLSSAEKLF